MRNLKKFLALVLAMIMIASATAIVSADDATDVVADAEAASSYQTAIDDLVAKNIAKGNESGDFMPKNGVKRYEMALFITRALGMGELAESPVPFTDVPAAYTGAIYYAFANGIVNGYSATKFGPDDAITYVQALKMAVAALGYEVDYEGKDWKWEYFNKANAIGLTAGMVMEATAESLDAALNREETAQIIYNMLYAPLADGSATLADKYFSNIDLGIGSETTFVITATPKQAYVQDANTTAYFADGNAIKETHVGIQALENGVPTGAIIYLPAADLGITENVEAYFNRSVTLVNYDAEKNTFDSAIVGDPAEIVNFADVTMGKNGKSITVDGTTYKLVTSLTGSYLNNEIVVFDSDNNAAANQGKALLKDEDGNIVDESGYILATLVVRGSGKYYVYTDYTTGTGVLTAVDESTALSIFGYVVPDTEFGYADYSAMTALNYATLNGKYIADEAFELHLYDDDKDGEYERAIYLPIYISSAFTYKSGSYVYDHLAEDVEATAADTIKASEVTYVSDEEITDGTVFAFTYNNLLNEVTVKEVITSETKTLKSMKYNKTNDRRTLNYTVTFTDGSSYTMLTTTGNTYSNTAIGGELITRNYTTSKNKNVAPYIDDVEAGEYLAWTDVATLVETAHVGEDYVFYASNGYIFFIEAVEEENDPYEYIVFDEINDIDLDAIYADLWYDGAYKTAATINKVKPVYNKLIADLNAYQLSKLLADTQTWYNHAGVWATQYADGEFAMIEQITKTETLANLNKYGLRPLDAATTGATAGTMTFNNGGVTVYDNAGVSIPSISRLITDSNTVFYFITEVTAANAAQFAGTTIGEFVVEAYKMMPDANASIEYNANTVIYTDALGTYHKDNNNELYGTAGTVIVFDAVAHPGFEGEAVEYRWLTTAGMSAANLVTGGMADAEVLGLKGYEEGLKLYAYTGAYDLETGEETVIYSTEKLAAGMVCKADKNGVIGVNAKGEKIDGTWPADIYGTFTDIFGTGAGEMQLVNTDNRTFTSYINGGKVYVELGAHKTITQLPFTFLIEGTVTARDIPVTEIIAIDINATDSDDVYEGQAAVEKLNAVTGMIYWVGTRTLNPATNTYVYHADSFKDGVAVFVFAD